MLGSSAKYVLPKGAKPARPFEWVQDASTANRTTLSRAEEAEGEAQVAALAAYLDSAPPLHRMGNIPTCHELPPGFTETDGGALDGAPAPDECAPAGGRGRRLRG